jgi:hypothetical protein
LSRVSQSTEGSWVSAKNFSRATEYMIGSAKSWNSPAANASSPAFGSILAASCFDATALHSDADQNSRDSSADSFSSLCRPVRQ